ncbi:MAG: DNA-binding protein [Clostridia bacterium]|nr:DNA-binding protein [Clostridia bacterium]
MHLQEEIYLAELLAVYGEMLTERQQEVMQMYFHQNQSLAEIADCFGIGRQSVHDCLAAGKAQLLKLEGALCVYSKLTKIRSLASSCLNQAEGEAHEALSRIIAITEE